MSPLLDADGSVVGLVAADIPAAEGVAHPEGLHGKAAQTLSSMLQTAGAAVPSGPLTRAQQIVALATAYQPMVVERQYRARVSEAEALSELLGCPALLYDRKLATAFGRSWAGGRGAPRRRSRRPRAEQPLYGEEGAEVLTDVPVGAGALERPQEPAQRAVVADDGRAEMLVLRQNLIDCPLFLLASHRESSRGVLLLHSECRS